MLVGYARVSSAGQSLEVQREQLTAAGCEKLFEEKRSGRTASDRPQLQAALEFVREGDALVVTRLDRLGRSVGDLHAIVRQLRDARVGFRCVEQPMDTTGPTGELMFNILAAFAQFENELRRERQRDGIAAAKDRGVYRGRRPSIDPAELRAALDAGEKPAALARRLGIARSSVYRLAAPAVPDG